MFSEEENRKNEAAEKAWRAEWLRVGDQTGFSKLSNKAEMLQLQETRTMSKLADLPALSLAGLSAKIAGWEEGMPPDDDVAWSIVEDVKRILEA